jgi:hypothetical protein
MLTVTFVGPDAKRTRHAACIPDQASGAPFYLAVETALGLAGAE